MKTNLLMVCILLMTITFSFADSVPPLINYQGKLKDAITGTKKFEFNIYDSKTGGNKIWGPQIFDNTPVINGYFNVILGSTDINGKSILSAFTSSSRFIAIKVNDGDVIAPRQQLLSVPYSGNASHADRADEATHAVNADRAVHATNSDNANHANHATNSDNANHASIANKATDVSNIVPVGSIMPFAGRHNNIPAGWLLCDGRQLDRTHYGALFNVIGTFWGVGNNYSTFNLPDLRGYFLRGVSLSTQRDPDAGARTRLYSGGNTGDIVGSYQGDMYKWHNHGITAENLGCPDGGGDRCGERHKYWNNRYEGTQQTHHSGGNETRPKNANVNYIIKY
jgi:hypothetical protein